MGGSPFTTDKEGVFLFMDKIHDTLAKKIYSTPMPRISLMLLLWIIGIADEKGSAVIYYKDIADKIGCSISQFYNALHTLKEYGFIDYLKSDEYRAENEVYVIGNDFRNAYRDYVDTGIEFFTERQYLNYKAGVVRAFLYIFWKVAKQHEKKEKNRLPHGVTALAKSIGVTERYAKQYLYILCQDGLISYVKEKVNYYSSKKKNDIITLTKDKSGRAMVEVVEKGQNRSLPRNQLFGCFVHMTQNICRRLKVSCDKINLNNTAMLFIQYKQKAAEKGRNIQNLIATAISDIGPDLDSRAVHHVLRNLLALDYNQSIILT